MVMRLGFEATKRQIPAITSGINWNGKTNSAVAKLLTSLDLAVTSSEVPEAFSSSTKTSSSSSDSEGLTCSKCACRMSSREDVSVPARPFWYVPVPHTVTEQLSAHGGQLVTINSNPGSE